MDGNNIDNYEVVNEGKYFKVLVYEEEGFVIKIPRDEKRKKRVSEIVKYQNQLAKEFDEVLPCEETVEGYIKMPIPDGVRIKDIDNWSNLWFKKFLPKLRDFHKRVKETTKLVVPDNGPADIFYDEEKDCIYLVDFSQVKVHRRHSN